MTLSEFKAWLEGDRASFDEGHPTAEQWTQIVNRLANVELINITVAPRHDLPTTIYPLIWTKPASPSDPVPMWTVTC